MDAVVQYLPSPLDRHDADILNLFGHNLYARVFKIMHDKMKGPITFFRIYSGKLEKVNWMILIFGYHSSSAYLIEVKFQGTKGELNHIHSYPSIIAPPKSAIFGS